MGRTKSSPALAAKGVGVYNLELTFKKGDLLDHQQGRSYYQDFHSRMVEIGQRAYDCPVSTVAAVYSALSPNNSEENCIRDTERALTNFRYGRWNDFHPTTYSHNKAKAFRILNGESPADVLSGEKTWNFYNNIVNPSDRDFVTIDGHMVNIWNGKRVPLDLSGISKSEYRIVASGVKELAGRYGLVPCQLQAILWITWRRVHRILYQPQYKLQLGEC